MEQNSYKKCKRKNNLKKIIQRRKYNKKNLNNNLNNKYKKYNKFH